jgi:surfeit locus 1 family protein
MKFNFNSNSYSFKPRLFPLFAFIVALSILLGLSGWQIKRLNWKTDLISQRISSFESDPISFINLNQPEKNEFRKVFVEGQLLNEFEMYMPALSKRGNNGFHILVPLKTTSGKFIIYDTGWVPLKIKEKEKRLLNISKNSQTFEAVIRTSGRKGYFQPDNDTDTNTWFFVEPELMSEYLKMNFENEYYLEAVKNGPNGFPLGNQTRIYLRNNHLQYALTWLMIACGLVGVFFFANIKKIK